MSSVSPSMVGRYADSPEAAMDPEWHALISQQTCTLAAWLHIPPNLVVAPRASHNTLDLSMRYPHHGFLRANGI